MANTTEETVLISLKVDVPTTTEMVKNLAEEVRGLKKATDDLNDTGKESTKEKELNTAAAARQETAAKKSKEAIQAEEGSIAALRKSNSDLTKERNNTSLATEEGRKKVEALNKQLDENNATIKENVDAYTKQKIGIGGYKDAILESIPGFKQATQAQEVLTQGMGLMGKAIAATGIGLIVIAIGSLIAYFKSSEEAENKWNKVLLITGTIVEQLMNFVEDLGGFLVGLFENPQKALEDFGNLLVSQIVNRFTGILNLIPNLAKAVGLLFEGKFSDAAKTAGDAVLQVVTGVEGATDKIGGFIDKVTEAVKLGIKQGGELADMQAKWDKAERALVIQRAQTALEVAKLREKAITEEGEQRKQTIKEAIALESALADAEVNQAKTKEALAKLEVKANGDTKDALNKVADATAAVIAADASRYEATLRFNKSLEAEDIKEAARIAKQEAEQAAAQKKKWDDEVAARKAANDKMAQDAQEAFNKEQQAAKDKGIALKQVDDAVHKIQQGNLKATFDATKINYQAGYDLFKKGALKQLLADTNKGAMAAYAALSGIPIVGPVLGAIAYGVVYAKGLASIAAVAGINFGFAQGGRVPLSGKRIGSGDGIPINRSNGDNLLATVRTGEVILNERHQAMLGGANTFRSIGVPGFAGSGYIPGFASSGFVANTMETRFAASRANEKNMTDIMANAILNMPQQVLVLEEFEAKQTARNTVATKADLI